MLLSRFCFVACWLAAMIVPSPVSGAVTLLEDDFNDGVIDPSNWSTPYGGVAEQSGRGSMTARGYWVSAMALPPTDGAVTVDFDAFIPTGWDFLTIAVRSDGVRNESNYNVVMNGVCVSVFRQLYIEDGYSVTIENDVDGILQPAIFHNQPYMVGLDDWFHVQVTYDFDVVSLSLNGTPIAEVPYGHPHASNYLTIYNREWNVTSYIDNVTVTQPAAPLLSNATPTLLADAGHGTGAAWIDIDADGHLDLHAMRSVGEADALYGGNGAGTFVSLPGTLDDPANGQGMDWGDFDNDGDLDVYVVNTDVANHLYRNDGGGSFSDATSSPLDHGWGDQGAVWVDYDRDGLLDLYLTTLVGSNRLFHNTGGGTFTDATPPALALASSQCPSSAWGDYDNDGDSDAYISVVGGPNALVRNDGGGAFVAVTQVPLDDAGTAQGAAWGDYDNDGDLDLYLCNFGQANRLFRNDGTGAFVNVATGPLADANQSQSGTWADFDNDRDLDLVLTNFGQPSYLLRNDGGNSFAPVATIGDTTQSLGAAWGDYDEDGDEDLFVANYGSVDKLFRNDVGSNNHWLDVALVGTASSRSAQGARVIVADLGAGVTQMREHGSNHGFWSVNAPVEHFGMGTSTEADLVVVRWPSGAQQVFTDVPADQRITVVEGSGIVAAPAIESGPAALSVRVQPNPFQDVTEIQCAGRAGAPVSVRIFDVQGRLVRSLRGEVPTTVRWDGRDRAGRAVHNGVYFYRVTAGNVHRSGKLVRTR